MKKITLLIILLVVSLGYSQVPGTAAPAPIARNAGDVISIYGDVYSNISGVNTNPNWGQGTVVTEVVIEGNSTLSYANFNYQGTDWSGNIQNISNMEFLHVDVWTNDQSPNVYVISSGPEIAHPIASQPGSWKSVDIPVAGITGNLSNTIQFKFDGGTGGTIYLDNLYFYKSPTDPLKDTTLSDLQVDGATINGFGPGTIFYDYSVPGGTVIVPQITSATTTNLSASTLITQASGIPGNATVVVTSADMTTTETYTVSFVTEGPPTAAPTPPARSAADVKSIFSDAYTNISVDTFDTPWCSGTTEEVMIVGNATKKVSGLGCEGVEFITGRFDATSFTHFHMDIYTDSETMDKSFNVKFSNWNGGGSEANAIEYSVTNVNFLTNPNPGDWISLDIPLSNFTSGSRNDLVQFIISSDLGTVYYDNLYLHKDTTLGIESNDLTSYKTYPNPTNSSWMVKSANIKIITIKVYDMLGKNVLSLRPNTNDDVTIDGTSLKSGLYFAKIESENGTSTLKLVKE